MSKSSETVTNLSPEQLAAERETPSGETVVVNQQTLAAGQAPSLNYPASDAYIATITPAPEVPAEEFKVKAGSDWWVDGAGEAHRRDQIVSVSIPKSGKVFATDRISLRLASGAVVHVPVSNPQESMQELVG